MCASGEVKMEHGVDSLVQLEVWSAAGFTKRKIDGDNREAFPMPGLTIVGHVWDMHVAYTNENDEVIVLGPFHTGHTDTYSGIFQVLASLTALAKWASDSYREWVEWTRLEGN